MQRIRLAYIAMVLLAALVLGGLPLLAQQVGPPPRPQMPPQQGTAGMREGMRGTGPRRGQSQDAQQPQQTAGPPGSVRGQVVSATGEPLRKAEVVLRPSGGVGPPPAVRAFAMTTDATGMFAFDGVPPGNYSVSAQRNGYVRQDGETRFGPRTTPPLVVGPGQAVTGVTIRLVPHGVVAGRVVDEDGEAVARVPVQVQRERWTRGQRQLLPVSSDTTNDLGEYRVAGLAAGRYFVSVVAGRGFDGGMITRPRPADGAAEMTYVPTYYPNATDVSQASPVDVGAGQETRGVDFQIRKVATYRIRGRVVDTSGTSARNLVVMVVPGESGMSGRNTAAVRNQDGTFEVRGITPGTYTVIANRMDREQGSRATATQQITVGNRDVDGVTLALAPPVEVTGSIRTEGNATVNLGSVRVALEATTGMPMFGGSIQGSTTNGSFTIPRVPAGNYRVRATNLPDGTYVKFVRQGQQEILESGLQVAGAVAPIDVVLGANAPSIAGMVNDADGKPATNLSVALIPDAPRRNQYHLYATTTTGETGAFTFRNVTPGDYKVFVLAPTEIEGIQNPAFLNQIESRGTSVRLVEGKAENVQLAIR